MEYSVIITAINALKGATDITKGIISVKSEADKTAIQLELNNKIIEAQQAIFDINEEREKLLNKVRLLEEQMSSFDSWKVEKERYILKSPWPGRPVRVYHLKKSHSNGEEPVWLCPNCFQNKQKYILNTNQNRGERVHLICSKCKTKIDTGFNGIDGPEYAEDIQ